MTTTTNGRESHVGPDADLCLADEAFAACLTEAARADMERACGCGTTGHALFQRARSAQDALLNLLAPGGQGSAPTPREPYAESHGDVYCESLAAEFRTVSRRLRDAVEPGLAASGSDPAASGSDPAAGAVAAYISTVHDLTVQLTHLLGLEP